MAETLTIRTASSTEVVKIAVPGPQGATGAGVPTGGSTGQVLRKASGSDYDTEWAAAGAGSGSVTSVALASTDLTITGSPITTSGTITANIAANAVTLEKIQTISSEHLLGRHGSGNGGVQQVGLGTGLAMSGSNVGVTFGSSAGTACQGNDSRLSDSRTPTPHAASHAAAGSDPLFDQDLNSTDTPQFPTVFLYGGDITVGQITGGGGIQGFGRKIDFENPLIDGFSINVDDAFSTIFANGDNTKKAAFDASAISAATTRTFSFPNADGTFALSGDAPASHAHGNLTNDGKLGSTAGLPVVTTTAGAVTTLALGTANQVLRVNSGASGVEFADPAASGVTGAAASASDVLGVSGANITGVDANADRLVFWDDSASALKYLEAGSGLSISGTTLSATASGGSKTYAVFTAEHNQPPSTAFATLDTRNSIAVLDFDDASTESAIFVGVMPEGASLGSGLIVYLHFMATTATSGNVRWSVAFERSNTDLDADSFDTATAATVATNGTSGIVTVGSITCTTIDSVTAGDLFRLRVQRLGADAADSMTGDAELVAVEVRSAA